MTENAREAYPSVLTLSRVKVMVHLGVDEKARRYAQQVAVDVRFYFPAPPGAAENDKGDYLSYHNMGERIHAICMLKEYRLIEYLAHEIYNLLRRNIPAEVKLWVRLHKLRILLEYVEGGASYTFTDLSPSAWIAPE